MSVLLLAVSRDGHAGREESHVPHVGEAHGETAVRTEDAHRGERTDDADPEGYHVRQGGDRDGHGSLGHGLGHPLLDAPFGGGASPRGQHDECVVDADTCEGGRGEVVGENVKLCLIAINHVVVHEWEGSLDPSRKFIYQWID